jgi:hypothetical protein
MDGWNYFNYFTEIEEYFWKKRGAHLLVSPLDWAIMEAWQKAGVPLEAVLKGIDRAFESYSRSRRGAGKPLKSLAYCTDAVLDAVEESKESAVGVSPRNGGASSEPFSRADLRAYFARNAARVRAVADQNRATHADLAARLEETAKSLEACLVFLDNPSRLDLEDLERRVTVLDERVLAELTRCADEELMLGLRRDVDRQLTAYRRKMKADQLAVVERQYLQKRLLDEFGLPRLSLFYFY